MTDKIVLSAEEETEIVRSITVRTLTYSSLAKTTLSTVIRHMLRDSITSINNDRQAE